MKEIYLLILLCLLPFPVFAQKVIKGRVLELQTRRPVSSATVTTHPVGSPSILSYTITAEDGTFSLKRNNLPDSVTVTVSAMTIERQSKTIRSDISFVEFVVAEKTMELKEVIVKAPKIRQLGDTLHFDVGSFLDETDRSIGDVLKKLPGIQVLSSGQILYQNKPISKFYVEGLDLLKGRYGIATQNVEAKNVAAVQILENHQPIKALKDMEIPSTAAINLKLKQSALGAFFATAQVGAGLPSLLVSNELVGMRFTPTQQNMLVYKGDNTGRDIAQELVSFYGGAGAPTTRFLNIVSPSPPSINRQHSLFNDAHMGSLNDLRTLKKDLTLTTNLNYLFDAQSSDSYARRDIFVESEEPIQIEEDMNAHLLKRELEGGVTLEGNTDEYYLHNKLNLTAKWNEEWGEVSAQETISQNLALPSLHLSNDFEYTRREGDKRRSLGASAAYTRQHNALRVSPVLFDHLGEINPPLQQDVLYNHFSTNAYISGFQQGWGRLGLGYSLGASYDHHAMQSDFFSDIGRQPFTADSLRNDISRSETSLDFSPGISYRFSESFRPSLSFPLRYVFLDRYDKVRNSTRNRRYLLYAPLLIIQYPLSGRLNLFSNLSFRNDIGGLSEDYRGYMMTSYRTMNRSDDLLNEIRTGNGFADFSYKNPFTTLFVSARISYSFSWRNTLPDVHYNGILSSATSIRHPHSTDNYGMGFRYSQSIDAIHSEVKLYVDYNKGNSLVLNQGVMTGVDVHSYTVSPSVVTDIGRFMIIKYDASLRQSRNAFGDRKMPLVNYFTQNLNTSFIPAKGWIFNVGLNHYYNNAITSSARSTWFANAGVRYKMKNMDWFLDWSNLFNTRQFVTYSYSDVSSYYSVFSLRPSEVMLKVRFKIF